MLQVKTAGTVPSFVKAAPLEDPIMSKVSITPEFQKLAKEAARVNNVTATAVINSALRAWDTFSRAVHSVRATDIVLCTPAAKAEDVAMLQALIAYVGVPLKVKAEHLTPEGRFSIDELTRVAVASTESTPTTKAELPSED